MYFEGERLGLKQMSCTREKGSLVWAVEINDKVTNSLRFLFRPATSEKNLSISTLKIHLRSLALRVGESA